MKSTVYQVMKYQKEIKIDGYIAEALQPFCCINAEYAEGAFIGSFENKDDAIRCAEKTSVGGIGNIFKGSGGKWIADCEELAIEEVIVEKDEDGEVVNLEYCGTSDEKTIEKVTPEFFFNRDKYRWNGEKYEIARVVM